MKSILLSINPYWVAKILKNEKTIEVRKTMPKCELPIDVYIYCTKEEPYIKFFDNKLYRMSDTTGRRKDELKEDNSYLNGKVVAKFTLKEIYTYNIQDENTWLDRGFDEVVRKQMGLTLNELHIYTGDNIFYGWKIDDLEIYDEPKEVSMFKNYCKNLWLSNKCWNCKHLFIPRSPMAKEECLRPRITKAPQSWCYVEVFGNERISY